MAVRSAEPCVSDLHWPCRSPFVSSLKVPTRPTQAISSRTKTSSGVRSGPIRRLAISAPNHHPLQLYARTALSAASVSSHLSLHPRSQRPSFDERYDRPSALQQTLFHLAAVPASRGRLALASAFAIHLAQARQGQLGAQQYHRLRACAASPREEAARRACEPLPCARP